MDGNDWGAIQWLTHFQKQLIRLLQKQSRQ
jgi:hypothetical protein